MAVTIAPAIEACQALVTRINAGTAYALAGYVVDYADQVIDLLEQVSGVRVDVEPQDETQLDETLTPEDRTSHNIKVYVRKQCLATDQDAVDALKLFTRQVFQQVNNWDSANGRVRVWECDPDPIQKPDKDILRLNSIFVASVNLRVEVEAS